MEAVGSDSVPHGAGELAEPSMPLSFACSVPRWGRSPRGDAVAQLEAVKHDVV